MGSGFRKEARRGKTFRAIPFVPYPTLNPKPELLSRYPTLQDMRLQEPKQPHQYGQDNTVEENPPENLSLTPALASGYAGYHDALGVDHLSHDAAGAVGGGSEDRVDAQLVRGDLLQIAEEDV